MLTKTHLFAGLLAGALSLAAGQGMAQTSGNTMKDPMPMKDSAGSMKSDAMKSDGMKSDMKADAMKKDTMKKDAMGDMKADGMKKDGMK